MSKFNIKLAAAVVAAWGACLGSPALAADVTLAVAPPDYTQKAGKAFKDYIEQATGGEITVRVVLHDALGSDRDATEQLRLGELEFNLAGGSGLAGVIPEVQAYNYPFLFPNRSVFYELVQDEDYVKYVTNYFLEKSGNTIRFLGGGENSIRNLYLTRGPVAVPSDLTEHGIKIRTREMRLDQDLFSALGAASVVALPAPERYTALSTGLIDATEGGIASAWAAGLIEVSQYVTLTGHAYDYFMLVANNDFYEGLSPEHQAAVREAARTAMWVLNGFAIIEEAEVLAQIIESGATVTIPTPDQLAQWRDIARPVADEVMPTLVEQEFIDTTVEAIERVSAEVEGRLTR